MRLRAPEEEDDPLSSTPHPATTPNGDAGAPASTDDASVQPGAGAVSSNIEPDKASDKGDKASTTRPKKTGRPVLIAQVAKWKDIPNWYSRTDCPLLQLPDHILDRCFSLSSGMAVRDYVALAGVNRFFRAQIDDTVFREICIHFGVAPHTELSENTRCTETIMSREVPDWYTPKERQPPPSTTPLNHYVPRGERANWSKAQYAVYRQERDIVIATRRLERYRRGLEASEKRASASNEPFHHPPVLDGQARRRVLGIIRGRKNGEIATAPHVPVLNDHYTANALQGKVWTKEGEAELERELDLLISIAKGKVRSSPADDDECGDDECRDVVETGQVGPRGCKRKRSPWVVPDTPPDSDNDDFEWEDNGTKAVHDFWPSQWRVVAAKSLLDARINKTAAKNQYKVSEAELLCLKHVQVHNPLSSKKPKQLFLTTAVEALAYRSHGGPIGHARHVATKEERSARNLATRHANIEKAKAEGRYEGKPKKKTVPPHWSTYVMSEDEYHFGP